MQAEPGQSSEANRVYDDSVFCSSSLTSPSAPGSTVFLALVFFVFFSFVFMLPDLIAAARELPPGPAELTDAERARAAEVGRRALAPYFLYALGAALLATGLGLWRKALPGLR